MKSLTILCLASYEKGFDFLRECRRLGCRVLLLTAPRTDASPWPMEAIDEKYVLPVQEDDGKWNRTELMYAVSYIARKEHIEHIVALDDYDLESAAILRDHLQIRGIGETQTRYFRDKLAMRVAAHNHKLTQPDFVACINEQAIREFMQRTPAPWVFKPRAEASALGVKKITDKKIFWDVFESLGDKRSAYILEQFIAGNIYHVDALVYNGKVEFAAVHRYGKPPMDLMHDGGIFTTCTVFHKSPEERALLSANSAILKAMGLKFGAAHTEFIQGADGGWYFVETAARVGGANIVDIVEAATGLNLWSEWAKIELLYGSAPYKIPKVRKEYAGLIISLAKQETPDLSAYQEPEIVWRLNKKYHAGLIVRSKRYERVRELLESYTQRFTDDFYTSLPAPDKPTN